MVELLYIMGHGFSGSTLLAFLLGAHPSVAAVGEMGIARAFRDAEDFRCSCGVVIDDCPFWLAVGRRMADRGHPFDIRVLDHELALPGAGIADVLVRARQRGPLLEAARRLGLRLVPRARAGLAELLRYQEDLAAAILEVRRRAVLVDGSKRPERAVFLARAPRLSVRIVHLVRDGRAVARSNMVNLGLSPSDAARQWHRDNRASERARRHFPADRWRRVRYEDLCRDPRGTLEGIFRFAGLDPAAASSDFRAVEHHIIGNRMRLRSSAEIRLDELWRSELSAGELSQIEPIVRPMNRAFGYVPG